MGAAGPAFQAGGGLVGAGLNFLGGLRQSDAYKQAAKEAKIAGAMAAGQQNRENAQLLGRQVTGYANSGVTLEGTPIEIIADSAMRGELASLMKKYQGDLQAYGLKQRAAATKSEAIAGFAGDLLSIGAKAASGGLFGGAGGGQTSARFGTITDQERFDFNLGFV